MKIDITKVNTIMKKKNITVPTLARLMNKRESFIYGLLTGTHGKTFKTVERLAKALKVQETEIIK